MPTISLFYGIAVRMYCGKLEHNPPHIHVYYQNYKAIIDINKIELTEGEFPTKQKRLIFAWVELHQEDLLQDWQIAQTGELPLQIEPLR